MTPEVKAKVERQRGTVKFFNSDKGWGMLTPEGADPDDREQNLFTHYSSIRGKGYRNLIAGQTVEYTVVQTARGLAASDVVVVISK